MRPGAAGTAGRDFRVPPKGGRHRADNPPDTATVTSTATITDRLLIAACGLAVLSGTCAVANAAGNDISAHARQAADLPTGARPPASAVRGVPSLAPAPQPTIVPTDAAVWSEEAGPVVQYGQALPSRREPSEPAPDLDVPPDAPTEVAPEPAPAPAPAPVVLPEPQPEPTQAGQVIGVPRVVWRWHPPVKPPAEEPAPEPTPTPESTPGPVPEPEPVVEAPADPEPDPEPVP